MTGRRPAATMKPMFVIENGQVIGVDMSTINEQKQQLADVADVLGVPLQPMPASIDRGVTFVFLPDDMDWPEVHVSLQIVNWRMQALDAPNSYCAIWCYAGTGIDTFTTVLHHLRLWGGDPHDEPTGWVKRHGTLNVKYNWRRQPGRRLDELGWDAFRPTSGT